MHGKLAVPVGVEGVPVGRQQMSVSERRREHLAQHILLGHLAVLEDQLAGVAAAHAQLVQLLRRPEALRRARMQLGVTPCTTPQDAS